MIVVKLMGGLGNQMFQYAFAQELTYMYGDEVCYDMDSYKTDKQRSLALSNLYVDQLIDWKTVVPADVRNRINREEKVYRVLQKGLRILHHSDRVGINLFRFYTKKGYYFNYDPYYYSLPKLTSKYIAAYGYFQGEPYFQHCINRIREQYRVRAELPSGENEKGWLRLIRSTNSVCVHIRVGDYKKAKNKRFDVCTREYFQRGIKYLSENVSCPHFFVFTNDPDAVRSQYLYPDAVYIEGQEDYQDMRLMLACKHFLISNSTFSWWTSFLAESPGKIVIVPRKWRQNQEAEPALMSSKNIEYIRL